LFDSVKNAQAYIQLSTETLTEAKKELQPTPQLAGPPAPHRLVGDICAITRNYFCLHLFRVNPSFEQQTPPAGP
jgi:hypothetical protein